MINCLVAQLSSDSIATAHGFSVTAGAPVLALCRKLIESSTFASSTPLVAYRRETLCLKVRSLGEAARLEINSKGTGFISRRCGEDSLLDSFSS